MIKNFKIFFGLLRIHHYIKNLFIFLPLFFALKITDFNLLFETFISFISFSMLASSVYIFNDLVDFKNDQIHPRKRNRAIASGLVKHNFAYITIIILLALSLTISYLINRNVFIIFLVYGILNIFYSLYLKKIALLDVCTLAIGFILRLMVGSFTTNIHLSMWIVIMTFLLSLFLAFGKRRDDIIIYKETGISSNNSKNNYNIKFLDSAMNLMAGVVIVSYINYITSIISDGDKNQYLYFTAFFVIIGILRYMQLTIFFNKSANPVKILFTDYFLQIIIFFWGITFWFLLY